MILYLFELSLNDNGPDMVFWSNSWTDHGLKLANTNKCLKFLGNRPHKIDYPHKKFEINLS